MDSFIATTASGLKVCFCVGPQAGERLCPCALNQIRALPTPAKGEAMPRTVEYYEKRAMMDQELILEMKDKIERLELKNNQLRQKREGFVLMPDTATAEIINAVADERIRSIETGDHHDAASTKFKREYEAMIATIKEST